MFQVGAQYMTIYKHGAIQCSCHRILQDLYNARDQPRAAQTFLCRGSGDVTVDLINVHAPSGNQRLTTNLLQSDRNSILGEVIGRARFLIGGDMNTKPVSLSHLLQVCRGNCSLHTQEHIHEPYLVSMEISVFSEVSQEIP